MNNNTFRLILYFVIFVILNGCSSEKKGKSEASVETDRVSVLHFSPAQINANNLSLGCPTMHTFISKVLATGHLEALPANKRVVTVWMGGTIKNLNRIPGDFVRSGESLFFIDNPEFIQLQEDFLTTSGMLTYQKEEYERQKLLAIENASAQKVFQKAEADYTALRARFTALQTKLQLLNIDPGEISTQYIHASIQIKAPISGYITTINSCNGQYVSDQTEIIEIVSPDVLVLNLSVFEKDIMKIEEGQTVEFSIPDASDEIFMAKVQKAGKLLRENRTASVHALFKSKNPAVKLIPGMFVKAEIITGEIAARALPSSALIEMNDLYYVLVKTNQGTDFWELEKKQVFIGNEDGDWFEILPSSGLKMDDQVVVGGTLGGVVN
jgi:membrane fusion protein, heavy metal efflux system